MNLAAWVDLDSRLSDLRSTPVPDANEPLMTSLVHADPKSSGSCLLVSFPVGWQRGAGSYSCDEHAIVLDGSIELDGELWETGMSFIVPAGAQRTRTFCPGGALAVAWFAGAPRWTGGGGPGEVPSSAAWAGDLQDERFPHDGVDIGGRRWRHFDPGESFDDSLLYYSWTH